MDSTLKLTNVQARKFWPIYDAYQRNLDVTNRQRVMAVEPLIALDKPLSDPYAKSLANELVAVDEAEVKDELLAWRQTLDQWTE